MAEIVLHFLTEPGVDGAEVTADLQAVLDDIAEPDGVFLEAEQPRFGAAEVLVIVQIVSKTIEVAKQLSDFVKAHRRVKGVEVEIDGHRVPIDEITSDQRARLQVMLAGPAPAAG